VLITRGYELDTIAFSTRYFPSICYDSLLKQHASTRLLFNEAVDIFASRIQAVRSTTKASAFVACRSYVYSTRDEQVNDDEDRFKMNPTYFLVSQTMPQNEFMNSADIFLVLTRSSKMLEDDITFQCLQKIMKCFPNPVSSPLSS
jgi:hypothetical protein